MKYLVILALLALVAVTFAETLEQAPGAAVLQRKEAVPGAPKDLDTANSYGYGYYPYASYGGGYGGGYGGFGYYPYYSYGGYGIPYGYGYYY